MLRDEEEREAHMEDLNNVDQEKLAEAAHIVWMNGKLRDGWQYAPETNKPNKKHSCLVPYSKLSEADKQSDRDLVAGIPEIIRIAQDL